MRTSTSLIALIAVVAVAAFGAGTASATAGYASCSGGFNPDGTSGSFYRMIKAKRVGCASAKKVVKAWVVKKADGENPTKTLKVKGFTCRGRAYGNSEDTDGGVAVTCKHGSRQVIRFIGHP